MAKVAYSTVVNEASGKAGTVVWRKHRSGPNFSVRVSPKNPDTAAQRAVRGYLSKAAKTFEGMTPAQVAVWDAYGETIVRHNPLTGGTYTSTGIAAFIELTVKFLQNNPGGTIPLVPPSSEFTGDSITVTASAGTGVVTFTASAPNSAGVMTELLLQKLPNTHREPSKNGYRSMQFFNFAVGVLTRNVSVPAGFYAAGYRFVKASTGQATPMVALPVQTVALSMAKGGAPSSAKPKAKKPAKAYKAPMKKAA